MSNELHYLLPTELHDKRIREAYDKAKNTRLHEIVCRMKKSKYRDQFDAILLEYIDNPHFFKNSDGEESQECIDGFKAMHQCYYWYMDTYLYPDIHFK